MATRTALARLFRHGGVRTRPNIGAGYAIATRGAGGHMQPPFVRRAVAYDTLPESDELVWDDGVAPETCLDFDAEHVSTGTAFAWLLGGFAFFGLLYGYQTLKDPENMRPTATRVLPYGNCRLALGGDPNKNEEEEPEEEEE